MAGMSPLFGRGSRRDATAPAAPAGSADPAHRTVTLIAKPGCHLCDDARAVIEKVAAEVGCRFEERDITQDEELNRAYWEQIPVVLIDGEQHTFWRVDEGRLRRGLGA
ncbi:glutaredoxin family protein [Streptomyces sp. NPDC058691]|uniref:glutaredoxin family protein n=1 Tax=Streptomyces sp. NPDC058691 TaxID=3346601 RepID=UPI00365A4353